MPDFGGISPGAPAQSALALTSGVAVAPGRAILISCSVAGNLTLTFGDNTTILLPVLVGPTQLSLAVKSFTNGTATVTVWMLY
ncbi:MAG TPA: hypothetical protein VH184_12540 [Dongiaceae bacterium]|jgi:hypothetical protein|nr:hypothetical protein [Dongiaceae bacterium]